MIHNVTEGCAEDAVEKSFLVAFVHKIRVRLFFFVPDHRHQPSPVPLLRPRLCSLTAGSELSVRFSPGGDQGFRIAMIL